MMTGFDLNTVLHEDGAEEGTAAPSSSSPVCLELWRACAGPPISLPQKGSLVVYSPQGHLEAAAENGGGGDSAGAAAPSGLPPHIFCRVVDVNLHAEAATDEVYAQLSLMPEKEESLQHQQEAEGEDGGQGAGGAAKPPVATHMFCKTLTASDTSTHGGFSVPRRAAEDCFPPLDYSQQRPSQEVVAKDLHGILWRFRHIYRGQPRRHLLTTGWSAFVHSKKLVSGDAVLFLRGEDGELRLGIRRAAQLKGAAARHADVGDISDVVRALSSRTAFHVRFNPRATRSEFVLPYQVFLRSLGIVYSVGSRFKTKQGRGDGAERSYTGMIAGISDMDPVRWPGSQWKCLLVRWDDGTENGVRNRVSPWEIEPSGPAPVSVGSSVPPTKRSKLALSASFEDPAGFQRVSQGQEVSGSIAAPHNLHPLGLRLSQTRKWVPEVASLISPEFSFSGEDSSFGEVLQGQEKLPPRFGPHGGVHLSGAPAAPLAQASSPSSVLMFQRSWSPSDSTSHPDIEGTKSSVSGGGAGCRLFGCSLVLGGGGGAAAALPTRSSTEAQRTKITD